MPWELGWGPGKPRGGQGPTKVAGWGGSAGGLRAAPSTQQAVGKRADSGAQCYSWSHTLDKLETGPRKGLALAAQLGTLELSSWSSACLRHSWE